MKMLERMREEGTGSTSGRGRALDFPRDGSERALPIVN